MSSAKAPEVPAGRLWPATPSGARLEIEVFGATGEYRSGKTLLGLSIAPGVHPEGHPFAGKPRTLMLDFEKSGGTYGGTGCHRIDVPSKMLDLKGGKYVPLDVFNWFLHLVENSIQPGQFDVIMADPISDIEAGLVEFVKKNHERFGLSSDQMRKAGGLMWGCVKDFWKQVLLKIGTKCQCFFFTSHLRDEFVDNRPTGRREPKGKETLLELASLYLWLERKAEKDGKVPEKPSAIVLKERLADTFIDAVTGELHVVQLMPPRLPEATVSAIRRYIATPPDYARLKPGERVKEEELTEEAKMRLALATAEAQRDTEVARAEAIVRHQEMVERQRQLREMAAASPQPSDRTAEMQAAKQERREVEAASAAGQTTRLQTDENQAAAVDAEQAEIDRLKAKGEAGVAAARAEEERLMATSPELHPEVNPAPSPAPAPAAAPTAGMATREQVERVKALVTELKVPPERLATVLRNAKASKVSDMTAANCAVLIELLEKEKARRGNSQAG